MRELSTHLILKEPPFVPDTFNSLPSKIGIYEVTDLGSLIIFLHGGLFLLVMLWRLCENCVIKY